MTFLLDNLLLIGIALASGGLLLWPLVRKGGGSAALGPLEATQLINHRNAIVVDLRDEKDFALGSLTGARNVPVAKLKERGTELARFKARPVLLVCEAGQQSTRAVADLKALGFDEAHVLAGGVAAWKQAGLPLVQAGRDTSRPAAADANRKVRNDQRSGQRSKPNRGARTPPAIKPGASSAPMVSVAPLGELSVDSSGVPSAASAVAASPATPPVTSPPSPSPAAPAVASPVVGVASPVVGVDAADIAATESNRVKEPS